MKIIVKITSAGNVRDYSDGIAYLRGEQSHVFVPLGVKRERERERKKIV